MDTQSMTFALFAFVLFILVLMSAFFSASETAFTSVNKIRLKNYANEGNKKATRALKLLDDYDKLLTTILVGNNLVNILSSSICTWMFTMAFGALGVAFATVFMFVVILLCGEITPKKMAKTNAERYTLQLGGALSFFMTVLSPITFFFKMVNKMTHTNVNEDDVTLTEDELVVMIDQIKEEGTLEKTESELIKSAIEFDDKAVTEILTPRVDVVGIEKTESMDALKDVFIKSGFSRIPVYDETIDRILGVVYAKDFYNRYVKDNGAGKIVEIMRPGKFIPEKTTVAKALTEIQRSMVQMVIVVDSYGGTVGIVSLEDVLEELVGEIWDESDEVQHFIMHEEDGTYAVLGDTNISDLIQEIGVELDLGDYDEPTVSGYIQYKLNRVPVKGDRIEDSHVKMIVRSVKNRRVRMVQVTVKPQENQDESA